MPLATPLTRDDIARLYPGLDEGTIQYLLGSNYSPPVQQQPAQSGQYTDDKAGTYNPEQWTFNPYTGQYDQNPAYQDIAQYGDPAMGTDVVYPEGGGTEHFAPGETPYSFLSAGDNYVGGVKAAVPGSDLYNELSDDATTRDLQGLAKIGGLVGGAAAAGGTQWSLGGSPEAAEGLTAAGLPTGAGIPAAPLTGGTGALGPAGSILGGTGAVSSLQPGDPGYDPFANMPTNVDDVMTVTGQRPDLGGGIDIPSLNAGGNLPGGNTVADAIGNIGGGSNLGPILSGVGDVAAAGGGGSGSVNTGTSGVPDWLANYLLPALNGLGGYLAADKASDAQAAADQAGIDEIKRQYDLTRSDQAPWLAAGTSALGKLSDPNANFMSSPDYNIIRDKGFQGIENTASASGGLLSGNALKALNEYNSGLAMSDFNNWYGNNLNLAGLGSDSAKSLGALGANASNNTASLLGQKGDARATGLLGKWGSLLGGLNQGYSNWAYGRP